MVDTETGKAEVARVLSFQPEHLLRRAGITTEIVAVGDTDAAVIRFADRQWTFTKKLEFPFQGVVAAAVSTSHLVLGLADKSVRVVSLATGKQVLRVQSTFHSAKPILSSVAISRDSTNFAACFSGIRDERDDQLFVWNLKGELLAGLRNPGHQMEACGFHPGDDNVIIVSGVQNDDRSVGVVRVDRKTLSPYSKHNLSSIVSHLCFLPNGKHVICATIHGEIRKLGPKSTALCCKLSGNCIIHELHVSNCGKTILVKYYDTQTKDFCIARIPVP